MSVRERVEKHQLVCFSRGCKKITGDYETILAIEKLLHKAPGFTILDQDGAYRLEGSTCVGYDTEDRHVLPITTGGATSSKTPAGGHSSEGGPLSSMTEPVVITSGALEM